MQGGASLQCSALAAGDRGRAPLHLLQAGGSCRVQEAGGQGLLNLVIYQASESTPVPDGLLQTKFLKKLKIYEVFVLMERTEKAECINSFIKN